MDWSLELVTVPVSDVDRAKAFYVDGMGFNVDQDARVNDELRFVQLTPPGSPCSIAIGEGISSKEPGSIEGLQIVVHDIEAAREQLVSRGLEVTEIQEYPGAGSCSSRTPTATAGRSSSRQASADGP